MSRDPDPPMETSVRWIAEALERVTEPQDGGYPLADRITMALERIAAALERDRGVVQRHLSTHGLGAIRGRYLLARDAGIAADDGGEGWDAAKIGAVVRSWQDVPTLHDELRRVYGDASITPEGT